RRQRGEQRLGGRVDGGPGDEHDAEGDRDHRRDDDVDDPPAVVASARGGHELGPPVRCSTTRSVPRSSETDAGGSVTSLLRPRDRPTWSVAPVSGQRTPSMPTPVASPPTGSSVTRS